MVKIENAEMRVKSNVIYTDTKIEIDFSGKKRKILVDGKELDLSKICEMEIHIAAGNIKIYTTQFKSGLPFKEREER